MKYVYIAVSIVNFHYTRPFCTMYTRVDDGELEEKKLTLDEARKLMWELKLAGGEKTLRINQLDPHITERMVVYWMRH